MKPALITILTFALFAGIRHEAIAFWGGDARQNRSGLDVAAGYDVNTVTTLNGTVITPPARADQSEHTQMTIASQQGKVSVLLGPWVYWERQGFTVSGDQEISITGSRAQGKDGSLYIFAQRLDNKSSGTSITLRSEAGVPMWSRSGSGGGRGQNSGRGGKRGVVGR